MPEDQRLRHNDTIEAAIGADQASQGGAFTSARAMLVEAVRQRARHVTEEDVRTTCSFARAERLLGREYHGRFLIELLQNAADAWRADARSSARRSRVAIVLTDEPALLVANEGSPMSAEVVISSLGHIGASTKPEGEAIGHKGIGFKSVLEVTQSPEIYSGLADDALAVSVSFDPERARASIREASPGWDDLVPDALGPSATDPLAAIPILRYPHWVERRPTTVEALAADGYDTVVRLPFSAAMGRRQGLTQEQWLTTVRRGLNDVSDHILLLLGTFSEVRIEDRPVGTVLVVRPEWKAEATDGHARQREDVRVLRNGEPSSHWRLYRRTLGSDGGLASDTAVGIRVSGVDSSREVVTAAGQGPSAPFHLFFPTRIPSGLPFLLHGYFEVDAARTGFYLGSSDRNRGILDCLGELVVDAVTDTASDPGVTLASLVNLLAAASEPEDPLAREFREQVLTRLDTRAWLPVTGSTDAKDRARPKDVLVATPQLTRATTQAFPAPYVEARLGLRLPDPELTDAALGLIASREAGQRRDPWDLVADLCRPGPHQLWDGQEADRRFPALLSLLELLTVEDRRRAAELLDGLRGDPQARLLPASGPGGTRLLLPVPDPAEGRAGQRSTLVMARARSVAGGSSLTPPPELDVAFLPDGLLSTEADIDRARPLGVRPFTVDTVLDRLSGLHESSSDPQVVLRFLWQLLSRERNSAFGTRRSAEQARTFDPNGWFWCRPGRAGEDDAARLRQQRERHLAEILLPARDGAWRPAGTLAFGADWADWVTAAWPDSPGARQRASAYRALEAIAPGHESLLASPLAVLALLDDAASAGTSRALDEGDASEPAEPQGERLGFLLRLGVWEIVPVEALESRDPRNRAKFPWTGHMIELRRRQVEQAGGWTFGLHGWGGSRHRNTYVAEDFRFAWSLNRASHRDPSALAYSLRLGARFYSERRHSAYFCPNCSDSGSYHSVTRRSAGEATYPSVLALELHHEPWLACTLDGSPLGQRVSPAQAWWHPKPPTGAGARQSPYRLLPLCGPPSGITDELRSLSGTRSLEHADLRTVQSLLQELRDAHDHHALPVDPSTSASARQAFIGLHRLAYERVADLAADDAAAAVETVRTSGVLCELGDALVFRQPHEARHDDGTYAPYVRHFIGAVPLVVLRRDHETRAARLGVPRLVIRLSRDGEDDGEDVTSELHALIGDRIPELLAIVVNHSLGTQTLELSSSQFDERARRLQALTVRRTRDLVIRASLEDGSHEVKLGQGSAQDTFLESATSTAPVLFHDLQGEGWRDRLRRKLSPHLATVLENSAYAHTFALFLQAETDAEREEFLLELGISGNDVTAVSTRLGVVGTQERERHLRWYRALLEVLGGNHSSVRLDRDWLATAMTATGLPLDTATALADAGGGEDARRETDEGSPLQLLSLAGVSLARLDEALRSAGDPGLDLGVTRRRFARWLESHSRRVAAALATREPAEAAKSAVRALEPPASLALSVDPPVLEMLTPVLSLLEAYGLQPDGAALARDPEGELTRLAGATSLTDLDATVRVLYDYEEQQRILRHSAAQWRRELLLLAVLGRLGPAETRSTTRAIAEHVAEMLPLSPSSPAALVETLEDLFPSNRGLADVLASRLDDSISSPLPDRTELLALAAHHDVGVDRLAHVERALEAPKREHARAILKRSARLVGSRVFPSPPPGLAAPLPRLGTNAIHKGTVAGRKKVTRVKVEASHDRRKRELGDEGEQWALASVIGQLLSLEHEQRATAVDQITECLAAHCEGAPVTTVLSHAPIARSAYADPDDLVEELTGLLHVARHSDDFGFDLLGWLPVEPGGRSQAMFLEVKSSPARTFHLSRSEWRFAQRLHDEGMGDRYAVLVVRRGKISSLPAALDLLVDPVQLHAEGRLRREEDGYSVDYLSEVQPP